MSSIKKVFFNYGKPAYSLIPIEQSKKCIDYTYEREKTPEWVFDTFNYSNDARGDLAYRTTFAKWLSDMTHCETNPENLMSSTGNSQGFDYCISTLFDMGDNVFMETPTYHLFVKMVHDRKMNVTSILRREEGEFDLEELEKLIVEKKPKGFYLVASNHNPSEANLSMKQRNALYNLSMKYKFYLIVDDVYESMYFNEDARLPPLYYCNDENTKKFNEGAKFLNHDMNYNPYVISLNSYSKIWIPGWRVGMIQAHKDLISKMGSAGLMMSSGIPNAANNQYMRSAIELGILDDWQNHLRSCFRKRIELMMDVLQGSPNFDINSPLTCGGYFIWIKLGDNVDVPKLRAQLESDNIVVGYGEIFVQASDREEQKFQYLKRRLRLGFSFLDEDVLVDGCKKIRAAIDGNSAAKI